MAVAGPATLKRALIDALAASGEFAAVQVAYSWPGRHAERECIYAGPATFEQRYAAMTSQRKPRDRTVVVSLHVEVMAPGATVEETDARVEELGEAVDSILAGNVTLSDTVPGLRYGGVVGCELDYAIDDDGAMSAAIYQISFSARIF